jgi:DNA-binding LytR/AlgR family response regulator
MKSTEEKKCGRKAAEIIDGTKMTAKLKEVLDYARKIYLFAGSGNIVAFFIAKVKVDFIYIAMYNLIKWLDPLVFLRVNKKYIVNMKHVLRFIRQGHGYLLYFKGSDKTATVSETYKDAFHRMLKFYPKIKRPKDFDLHFT